MTLILPILCKSLPVPPAVRDRSLRLYTPYITRFERVLMGVLVNFYKLLNQVELTAYPVIFYHFDQREKSFKFRASRFLTFVRNDKYRCRAKRRAGTEGITPEDEPLLFLSSFPGKFFRGHGPEWGAVFGQADLEFKKIALFNF